MSVRKLYREGEHNMSERPQIPRFQAEAEEAQWWFDHREDTTKWLAQAVAEGRTTSLARIPEKKRRAGSTPTILPQFGSEADEALWWDEHRAQVEENLGAAIRSGTALRGTAQRVAREARASKNVTIRMPLADL